MTTPKKTKTDEPAQASADKPEAPGKGQQTPAETLRQSLGITGDVRVSGIQINIWQGQLLFGVDEGEKTDEGFVVTRGVGQFSVTGDDFKAFLKLKSDGDETSLKAIMKFLHVKLLESLSNPPPRQQG